MKIAFLGDVALYGRNSVHNTQFRQMYEPIMSHLNECDYVVANLETPLTSGCKTVGGKSAYIKGQPEDVEILNFLKISHVSLANNHMFDYCEDGLIETLRILDENNIAWYGVNNKTVDITDSNTSVTLMGYCCYSTNGKGLGRKETFVNVLNPYQLERDMADTENRNSLPILSLHWGQEHVHYPNYDHVLLARKLCKKSKCIIHGHHPHVIQGLESIGDSLVAYSLGNFCFDDVYTSKSKEPLVRLSIDNKESVILIVEIIDNRIVEYKIVPFSFESGVYTIKPEMNKKLQQWSEFLNSSPDEYMKRREKDLSAYLTGRKSLRNAEWYLKRLNMESMKMLIAGIENQKKYDALVKKYISV